MQALQQYEILNFRCFLTLSQNLKLSISHGGSLSDLHLQKLFARRRGRDASCVALGGNVGATFRIPRCRGPPPTPSKTRSPPTGRRAGRWVWEGGPAFGRLRRNSYLGQRKTRLCPGFSGCGSLGEGRQCVWGGGANNGRAPPKSQMLWTRFVARSPGECRRFNSMKYLTSDAF